MKGRFLIAQVFQDSLNTSLTFPSLLTSCPTHQHGGVERALPGNQKLGLLLRVPCDPGKFSSLALSFPTGKNEDICLDSY